MADSILSARWVFKRPLRSFHAAMRYWWPTRLTMAYNPRVHAWLWWNL